MRMPLLIRWPQRVKPGTRINAMIQNVDYAPTFLEIAGLPAPEVIQGRSLLSLRRQTGVPPSTTTPPHSGAYNLPKIEGVRGDRFKLIGYYDHPKLKLGEQWELFELEQDPQELHSQHANPEFAAPRTWLEAELQRLRHDYGVPRLEASSPPLLADKTSCVTFAR